MSEEMFEKASRLKLRFPTPKGNVDVEDLWVMPLSGNHSVTLDGVAKSLNRAIKDTEEESFVVKRSTANNKLNLKFEIVKYIISVRLREEEEAKNAVSDKMHNEKILELIAKKKDSALEGQSVEELEKMLK
jgi:hypothetical protein